MAADAEKLFEEFKDVQTRRSTWNDHFQLIGDYIHGTEQQFTEKVTQGERLNENLFSSDGVFATRNLSSALIGMLWPNGAQSMRLQAARGLSDSRENKEYFEFVTEELAEAMDDPVANLASAVDEYMLDQTSFGTSGIGVFKNETGESDLHFESYGTSQTYIAEGVNGKVDSVYRLYEWPLTRVMATFGSNVSKDLKEKFKVRKHDLVNVKIIRIIKPRKIRDILKKGNTNMPFMSVFMEHETKHILRESGFIEQPVKIGRFRKLAHEIYGRSPGQAALSDVLELDYLTERFSVNVDKTADPPLMVTSDAKFGGGIIDTSAHAINVVDVSGMVGNNIDPIRPLFTTPELDKALIRMTTLEKKIAQHFFLDRLLDFNNTTPMTLGEVQLRDRLRGISMGSIFTRQIHEVFNPTISRSFSVQLSNGKLGVIRGSIEESVLQSEGKEIVFIPQEIAEAMAQGRNVFEIKYFTPAQRALDSQKGEALNQVSLYIQSMAAINPTVADNIDTDEMLRMGVKIAGLPNILKSKQQVEQIRTARADVAKRLEEQEQQQVTLQQAETVSNISKQTA